VELQDNVVLVFEVAGRIPGTIWVVETGRLDSILDLVSVVSRVKDFLHFPLLLFLDDNGRWWRQVMSGDRFCTGCWFEEADMENWVDFDSGWQVQLIGASAYFLQDGIRAYLLVVQLVQWSGCLDVFSPQPDFVAWD